MCTLHNKMCDLHVKPFLHVHRYIAIRNNNDAKFALHWSASTTLATELVGLADSMAVAVVYLGFPLQLKIFFVQAVCACARAYWSAHHFSASHNIRAYETASTYGCSMLEHISNVTSLKDELCIYVGSSMLRVKAM